MTPSLEQPKRFGQGFPKPPVFSIGLSMENARRRRFVAYFSGEPLRGDRAKLMKKTGLTKGRVTQLLDKDEAFGELAARNLAGKLGLAPDYFEHDHGMTPVVTMNFDAETLAFAKAFAKLDPTERQRLSLLYQVARTGKHPDKIKGAISGRDSSSPEDLMLGGDSGLGDLGKEEDTTKKGRRK